MAVLNAEAPKPSYQCIAQRFAEKLLNSPNDVVQAKDGSYYFTDPPYGLSDGDKSPEKQQPVNGVYRLAPNGEVTLLVRDLTRPNGLAFSPDGQFLYIANSDPAAAKWWRYPVLADGKLGSGTLWYDATSLTSSEAGLPDGLKVKKRRNRYCYWSRRPLVLEIVLGNYSAGLKPVLPQRMWHCPRTSAFYISPLVSIYWKLS